MNANRLIVSLTLLFALAVADRALHHLAPVQPSTVGHRDALNGRFYGWGFDPHEPIRLRDADTGEVFIAPANNHGWRDVDRKYEKPEGTFRILALGDSNTFGVLVPAEETWTRVLERRLAAEGYRAEVLNIGYSQWGTDQELEALRREGVRYRPDLVIVQFTINDLTDNTDVLKTDPARKPFYYRLDETGALERHENPAFTRAISREWRHPLHIALQESELAKRAYIAWTNVAALFRPEYLVLPQTLEQLKTVLRLRDDDALLQALTDRLGSDLSGSNLEDLIEASGKDADKETVLRVLENRPFKQFWMSLQYDPLPPDPLREDWRLLLALLKEIQTTARAAGADVAILSDQEEGLYDWERYWYRVGPGEEVKRRFLEPTSVVRTFAGEHGMGFIENRQRHVRARNDSHPNREGTRAMAENAYAFVIEHYRERLDATRTGPARPVTP